MVFLSRSKLKELSKSAKGVHNSVAATYFIFSNNEGKRIIQVDTYGSEEREIPNKVSQSIQLDEEILQFLLESLRGKNDK